MAASAARRDVGRSKRLAIYIGIDDVGAIALPCSAGSRFNRNV
jgi:hypothetical protein